jgi:hypothetical protein
MSTSGTLAELWRDASGKSSPHVVGRSYDRTVEATLGVSGSYERTLEATLGPLKLRSDRGSYARSSGV